MQIKVARPPPTLFAKGIELPPVLSETKKKKRKEKQFALFCLSPFHGRAGILGKRKEWNLPKTFLSPPLNFSPSASPLLGFSGAEK